MKGCRLRYFAVLLAVCITGCATVRDIPNCPKSSEAQADKAADRIWPGARIALAAGRFSALNTVELTRTNASPGVNNPAFLTGAGVGAGAAKGAAYCSYWGTLEFLCLPFGAAVGAVYGGVVGAVYAVDANAKAANTQEGQEKAAKMEKVQAAEGRIAAAVESVDLNRFLLDEIARYARESGVGSFPELYDQGPKSLDDKPQYHGPRDFVFEIVLRETAVIEEVFRTTNALRLFIQGRLIRISDDSVVSVFTASEITEVQSPDQWNEENGKLVIQELKNALGRVAKQSVDQWIRPVINGENNKEVTVVIFRRDLDRARLRTVDISIDGCKVGSLGNDSYVTVKTWAGKRLMRSEGFSVIGKEFRGVASQEINVAPGKTHYFVLNPFQRLWYFTEIEEGAVKKEFPDYKETGR